MKFVFDFGGEYVQGCTYVMFVMFGHGGNLRNAIPREASAVFSVPEHYKQIGRASCRERV